MKKLLASVLTAGVMTGGALVASGGSPASASYPGEVTTHTTCKAPAQVPAGKVRPIKVKIGAAGATPRGYVQIVIRHAGKVAKFVERKYKKGFTAWTPRTKKKGRYNVIVRFIPASSNSPYAYSKTNSHYRVTK